VCAPSHREPIRLQLSEAHGTGITATATTLSNDFVDLLKASCSKVSDIQLHDLPAPLRPKNLFISATAWPVPAYRAFSHGFHFSSSDELAQGQLKGGNASLVVRSVP